MVQELILLSDVEGLGEEGSVVKVHDGYARNYLIPRKLAAAVTAFLEAGIARDQIVEARSALDDWEGAHARFVVAMNSGDYAEAVRLATTTTLVPGSPPTAAASYDRLDGALSRLIADARSSMRAFINDGLAATQLVSTAVLLLSVLAILAVWIGVRPRLQEYL